MKVAIIDLGTNSLRLFIYSYSEKKKRFRKILKHKRMVRLGDLAFESRLLSDSAKKRTLEAFIEIKEILSNYNIEAIKAVATSALRSVRDGSIFAKTIEEKTGIPINIISGSEEAKFIAKGIVNTISLSEENLVFIDIGGGSTEVSLAFGRKILVSKSLKFGAGRCQQVFLKNVPPKEEDIENLRVSIKAILQTEFKGNFRATKAVGTSGSIRAFKRIIKDKKSEKKSFSYKKLSALISKIETFDKNELLSLPNLEDRRVDLILAAGIILEEVLMYFGSPDIYVSSVALKDGILVECFNNVVL